MTRFEELQQIWQSQPQDEAPPLDIRGTTDELRRFGRRQHLINSVKAICILLQAWYCLARIGVTLWSVTGEALLVAGLSNLLLADWRTQLGIAKLDFSSPSASFVEEALERMRHPNAGYAERLGLNMLLICVGYNVLELSRTSSHGLLYRLAIQLGVTVFMLVATLTAGLKMHAKRCELEYRPIKSRLLAMRQSLEDRQL
jgi:hypothetical protein